MVWVSGGSMDATSAIAPARTATAKPIHERPLTATKTTATSRKSGAAVPTPGMLTANSGAAAS
jgi:hypothetical protein